MMLRWYAHRMLTVTVLGLLAAVLEAVEPWLGVGGVGRAVATISTDPVLGVTELVRLTTLVATVWLLGVTLLDTMGTVVGAAPLRTLARHLAPSFWRAAVLRPAVALAIAVPPALIPTATITLAAAQSLEVETIEPHHVDRVPRTLTMTAASASSDGPDVVRDTSPPVEEPALELRRGTAEPRPHADEGAPPTRTLTMTRQHLAGPPAPSHLHLDLPTTEAHSVDRSITPVPTPPGSVATHIVVSGDNLWSIAAAHLADERGRRPSTGEITSYWRQVIDTNRHRLPDPLNPDLLFPGVQLVLPPVG